MITEEKAKAYDEALEQAKKELKTCGSVDCDAARQIFRFFPELRESEDERIRKDIIWYIKRNVNADESNVYSSWIAWLEKQKDAFENGRQLGIMQERARQELGWPDEKQKDSNDMAFHEGYTLGFEDGMKKKEQNPAEWSEEDEDMLNSCISSIEEAKENRYAYKETDGDTSYDHEIAWLKSLRPFWKPSEWQMSMLLAVINDPNNAGSESCYLTLKSIYEQLKKL